MSTTLHIVSLSGPAMVEDGGRPGAMHQGVPEGGALHAGLLAEANGAVGNDAGAAAIEAYGGLVVCVTGSPARVAWSGTSILLDPDIPVVIPRPATWRVRYLAVAGGLDVPIQLGGRGTLLAGSLGGVEGRWLRAGDAIPVGQGDARAPSSRGAIDHGDPLAPIRIVTGPDLASFAPEALARLCEATYSVSPASDRIGTRLRGPAVERVGADAARARPMMRGAVQVPGDGAPVVLGPDHPTTGGYPVLAQVIRADAPRMSALRPGSPVSFVRIDVDEARHAWEAFRRTVEPTPAT